VVRVSLPTALLTATTLALAVTAPALADTSNSSNWAGYAVHRSGVHFTKVAAAWRQPSASCTAGRRSYSALWVGLGGYSESANALEQVGTEVDCTASGRVSSSAWFELVPDASESIRMRVRPGDSVAASVTVFGHRVLIGLYDASTHEVFQKTLQASHVDVSSAEWILEAPSACISETACQTLPLADFHSATFALADAESTTGHVGTISDPAWTRTKIRLTPPGRRFVVYRGSGATAGTAAPSGLSASGSSFKVAFSKAFVQGNPFFSARRSALQAGFVVHPGR
jgi:Peptidase A4 family